MLLLLLRQEKFITFARSSMCQYSIKSPDSVPSSSSWNGAHTNPGSGLSMMAVRMKKKEDAGPLQKQKLGLWLRSHLFWCCWWSLSPSPSLRRRNVREVYPPRRRKSDLHIDDIYEKRYQIKCVYLWYLSKVIHTICSVDEPRGRHAERERKGGIKKWHLYWYIFHVDIGGYD